MDHKTTYDHRHRQHPQINDPDDDPSAHYSHKTNILNIP